MTEPEDFLTRWSRRKRKAEAEDQSKRDGSVAAEAPDQADQDAQGALRQTGDAKSEDVFDLSKLPSLDSIGPETDIRIFMQPGVPAALSRAALRRAWSADPVIRDFIGLSENSWDFTANDGVHGFGALDPADAKRLIERLLGGEDDKDVDVASADREAHTTSRDAELVESDAVAQISVKTDDASGRESDEVAGEASAAMETGGGMSGDAASQDNVASQRDPEPAMPPARRLHGRALPQ